MKPNTENTKSQSCPSHAEHPHVHGVNCGHKAVKHDDHTDYEHDGHLHRIHEDHVDECNGSDPNSDKLAQDALKIIANK